MDCYHKLQLARDFGDLSGGRMSNHKLLYDVRHYFQESEQRLISLKVDFATTRQQAQSFDQQSNGLVSGDWFIKQTLTFQSWAMKQMDRFDDGIQVTVMSSPLCKAHQPLTFAKVWHKYFKNGCIMRYHFDE